MTDFRALCAELVDLLDCFGSTFNIPIETSVVARARAALARCGNYPVKPDSSPANQPLAAALRAVADQVVPEEPLYGGDQRWEWERDARQSSRKKMLAIADELEAQP